MSAEIIQFPTHSTVRIWRISMTRDGQFYGRVVGRSPLPDEMTRPGLYEDVLATVAASAIRHGLPIVVCDCVFPDEERSA